MREFGVSAANKFFDLMISKGLAEEEAGTVAHTLMDTHESVEKVYGELLSAVPYRPDVEKSVLEERLWEICEEFQHIDYHIHEAGFTHSHFDDAD